jgi:hypothetical protein
MWSPDRVVESYSCGQGLRWMYGKRMRDLRANGLVLVDAGVVSLTERGRRSAEIFFTLRRLFRLER